MIKVPYTIAELDVMAAIFYKEIKSEFHLKRNLLAWPNDELKLVMTYLHNNLDAIITGQPSLLEHHATIVNPMIEQAKINYEANHSVIIVNGVALPTPAKRRAYINRWAKGSIEGIFNYDFDQNTSFTQRDNGLLAYRHAKRLKIDTCPYCNAQFTFTIKNKRVKSRPHFDHFLYKGKHPYLALSFYNLIPSCAVCNSGLKGQKNFSINTHLHPFIDNIEGLFQFRTKINAIDFLVKGDKFYLSMQPCKGTTRAERKRAKTSIEVFAINDRYKFHKDYAEEILKKAYFYNKSTIEDLFTSFKIGTKPIFTSVSEIKELVIGNYMHPDHLHKRILSKVAKDISEEFGLVL